MNPELMALLVTAFGLGFLGSGHCIGMCGGVVASLNSPTFGADVDDGFDRVVRQMLFNFGRLGSYIVVGSVLAVVANGLFESWQSTNILRIAAALMTIAIGLSITGWLNALSPLETLGGHFWALLKPLTQVFVPATSPAQILGLGIMWGWLPCGLVYSAASYAAVAGNVINGGLVMLVFGLGTLPSMFLVGISSQWLLGKMRSVVVRKIFGVIVIGIGGVMLSQQLGEHNHRAMNHEVDSDASMLNQQDHHRHH